MAPDTRWLAPVLGLMLAGSPLQGAPEGIDPGLTRCHGGTTATQALESARADPYPTEARAQPSPTRARARVVYPRGPIQDPGLFAVPALDGRRWRI